MAKGTMKAVIFKAPHQIAVEDRPIPEIKEPTDVIVKVIYSALCGSELHVFRGHQPSPTGFIMGHEFTGTVEEIGSDVKNFKKGDQLVSPFTVSWSVGGHVKWDMADGRQRRMLLLQAGFLLKVLQVQIVWYCCS